MHDAPNNFSSGHVVVPAIKTCPRCGQRAIDIRRRATFAIGFDGNLICVRCVDAEHESQGESMRLFTPAPNQIEGQLSL